MAVILFLGGFFFLYGLLNFYFLARARAALALGPAATTILLLFLLLVMAAPVLVRLSENAGLVVLARAAALVGLTWIGVLFLFVCATIVIDVSRLLLVVVARISSVDFSGLITYGRTYFLASLGVVAAISIYGAFEAQGIRSDTITIRTTRLPTGKASVRIVQISDVHLGLIVRQGLLKKIIRQVKDAKPDLLVSTGDLVDGQMNTIDGVTNLLEEVKPRFGKYAVTGNHEFYAGLDQALAFTRKAGFRVLRGETATIPGVMNIVGVDDPAGPGIGASAKGEKNLLASVPNSLFVLLLKHRPSADRESIGLFDLQLSGHVHDGQIFPFRIITRLFYPLIHGLYPLSGRSALYVNRGTGTWGPPIRFLAPPEVTIIDLLPQAGK